MLKSPWSLIEWSPHLARFQEAAQLLVACSSIFLCGLAARRLLQVRLWTESVEKIAADNFNQQRLEPQTIQNPMEFNKIQ